MIFLKELLFTVLKAEDVFSLEFSIPFLQITGPAGTGKTESVKALGHQLGRFVLVFNCDETFDFQVCYSVVSSSLRFHGL